jgi:Tol biopolymer transport system component
VSVARPLYATGEPELTLDGWSQDGRSFLLHSLAAVLRLPAGGGGESEKLAEIRGITGLQVSPDGRQVAFAMNTPRPEVYVAEFPSFGGRRLVSTDGGCQPQWRGDGKELFYVAADGYLMATSSGAAQRLFRPGLPLACNWSQYAAGKDGRRFYAYRLNTDAERQADLNIALHWAESLAKR